MGQCGCGELVARKALKVGNTYVTPEVYRGCRYCGIGPGVYIYFFDEKGRKEWLEDAEIEEVTPNEYGGWNGHGYPAFGIEISEIVKVVKAMNDDLKEGYDIEGFLEDFGLEILQKAIAR